MVAGTSTGAIIAGLITTGHTALQIETLYENLVTKVFDHRMLVTGLSTLPLFTKEKYRDLLKEVVKDITLEEACRMNDLDLMITAKDMSAAEETFFSCFKQPDAAFFGNVINRSFSGLLWKPPCLHLRTSIRWKGLSTAAPPLIITLAGCFYGSGLLQYRSKGGFGLLTEYSACAQSQSEIALFPPNPAPGLPDYQMSKITIFSFGTASPVSSSTYRHGQPAWHRSHFLVELAHDGNGSGCSAMQVDTFRSPMMKKLVDFRRFQISLDPTAIGKLPNIGSLDEKKISYTMAA